MDSELLVLQILAHFTTNNLAHCCSSSQVTSEQWSRRRKMDFLDKIFNSSKYIIVTMSAEREKSLNY